MPGGVPDTAGVVVIGAGLIGASVACHLARRGAEVVVLERGAAGGQGATARCVGGLRTQFTTPLNVRLSLRSQEIFDRFPEEYGAALRFDPLGYLFLAGGGPACNALETAARVAADMGLPLEVLSPRQIRDRWPFLETGDLCCGTFTPADGFYGPMEVLRGYLDSARACGARILEGVSVEGLEVLSSPRIAVRAAGGRTLRAERVVNAAGPWAGRVAALAGQSLPVEPLRRHLFFAEDRGRLPARFPMVFHVDSGWYLKREGGGVLLGGPAGGSHFGEHVEFEAEVQTVETTLKRVPAMAEGAVRRGWIGHYEVTPDGEGVIGAFPEAPGLVHACGFSGHGFQHSAAVGELVAELVLEGRIRSEDVSPLRPTRFREGAPAPEPLSAFRRG